jgi:hypothetical protein
MSALTLQNHSLINSAASTDRLPRARPVSTMDEQWRKSSNDGWKTSSSALQTKKPETWKMSGKPRHAQLKQLVDDDPRSRRQSATATMMNNSPWQPKKPLPQEPFNMAYTPGPVHDTAPFHIHTPMMAQQSPVFIQANNTASPYPPPASSYPPPASSYPPSTSPYLPSLQANMSPYTPSDMMYPTSNPPVMILPPTNATEYQQPEYSNYINSSNAPPPPLITDQLSMYPPPSSTMSQAPLPIQDYTSQMSVHSPPKPASQPKIDKNKKKEKPESKSCQLK